MKPVLAASSLSPCARLHVAAASLREEFGIPVEASLARGRVSARIAELFRAQAVQRQADAPVLSVSAAAHEPYRRILLASALLPEDAAMLVALRRDHPHALLELVHVYQWHAVGHVPTVLRQRARRLGADLLVLTPEPSWLKAALGASVTDAVLGDPPCDVLLMPRGCGKSEERYAPLSNRPYPRRVEVAAARPRIDGPAVISDFHRGQIGRSNFALLGQRIER